MFESSHLGWLPVPMPRADAAEESIPRRGTMRLHLTTIAILTTAVAAISASPANAERSCGSIHGEGQALKVTIARGHASCTQARQITSSFFSGHWPRHGGPSMASLYWSLPGGWRCTLRTNGGAGCWRGGSSYLNERDLIYAVP